MPTPKVSIVIPVYNVEKYIERCVRTLFAQTLDDLEYIFVDDCSPDNSSDVMLKVLEEYPVRKPQVKLIRHEINQGVSQSRQDGVEAATGEYIIHCDPDDWVELDMYEQLYTKAKETNADLVLCDYYEVTNGEILTLKKQKPDKLKSEDLLAGISGKNKTKLQGSLWNKLIKSELCKNIRFIPDINFCEDVCYLFQILNKRLNIRYCNTGLYYYMTFRTDSAINQMSQKCFEESIKLIKTIELLSLDSSNEYMFCCNSFIIEILCNRVFDSASIGAREFNRRFKKYIGYLSYNRVVSKKRKLMFIISLFGLYPFIKYIYSNIKV